MRLGHLLSACLLVGSPAGTALANGRDPYASTINFQAGQTEHIIAGMTFGLIRSDDGGATWQWYCEKDVGYGGMYDPDYAYSASGALFATTFDGLKVMRDGCNFVATPPGMTFVSSVERAANGDIYVAASDANDTKMYKSSDDGATFPPGSAQAFGMPGDTWDSIMVASDSQHVYVSGHRSPFKCTSNSHHAGEPCVKNEQCLRGYNEDVPKIGPANLASPLPGAGGCEPHNELLLFKSVDGGATYTAMSGTDISPISQNSTITIAGIDPSNPDIVYAHISLEAATSGESIYKSTNGGVNWTKILTKNVNIGGLSFLVRGDGSCVAGTRDIGAWKTNGGASGCGTTWTDLVGAPHIGCLYRDPANDAVWACTQNTASPQLGLTTDGFGIMKSSDLATWTGVLAFQDIQAPVACGESSVEQTMCIDKTPDQQSPWCCLTSQLGITSNSIDCSGEMACFGMKPDATVTTVKPPDGGCCDATSGPPLGLTLLAGGILFPRRRKRRRS